MSLTQVQQQAAASLVDRARYGDQNAMGMLAMIGQAAEQGSPRAKNAKRLVQEYIEKNPVRSAWFNASSDVGPGALPPAVTGKAGDGAFGSEEEQATAVQVAKALEAVRRSSPLLCSAVKLANGPAITDQSPVVVKMQSNWGPAEIQQFEQGLENWRQQGPASSAEICGRVVGYALCIQESRKPNSDLREWGPNVAWELGY